MYEKFETDTSEKYLKQVINALEKPVCLMGGWSVRYYVNKRFKNEMGRDYLGSRDIDLGFRIKKDWTLKELKNSDFAKAMTVLEKQIGFELQGFRMLKQIERETGRELTSGEAKEIILPNLFDLYVDLMISEVHPKFREAFGFIPAEEFLLQEVFSNAINRKELELSGKVIYMPSVEILIAMKLNSVVNRDKEHKQIKDLYDIVALALYYTRTVDKETLNGLYSPSMESRKKLDNILNEKCTDELWRPNFGIPGETAKKTIQKLLD